jgi:L-malate glycosyltransferase
MNILVLCHEYPPLGGGGGVSVKQYAEEWASKGHKVTLVTSWVKGLKFRETVSNVDVIRIFTIGIKSRATIPFISMFFYIIIGILYIIFHGRSMHKFEIINSHFSIPTGLLGVVAARILRIPQVLTIIGGDIYDPTKRSSPHRQVLLRVINTFILNSSDQLVAISSDTKKRAQFFYKVKQEIIVINLGFVPKQLRCIKNLRDQNGHFKLIAVGRLIKRKGFDYLIDALQFLPNDIILYIVGDGPLENKLNELVAKKGLTERVSFTGYLSESRKFDLLQSSDCYVLSSIHEGLGIVVQEAMYAGLPIVSTNNGGQIDLIKQPRNGILVDPENSEKLAEAIMTFYSNREYAESVALNNKQDIQKFFISNNAKEYITIFTDLKEEKFRSKTIYDLS